MPQLVRELADGAALSWERRRERLREILSDDRLNGPTAVAAAPRPAEPVPHPEGHQEREAGRKGTRTPRQPAAGEPGRPTSGWHEGPGVPTTRQLAGHEGLLVNDRYLLTALIGQGGMARVWRGHDQRLKRPVAVKEILFGQATLAERASLTARMEYEAQAAARMRHQNIVAVHDAFHFHGIPWIVMECVPGTGLDLLMRDQGPLAWQQVAALGAQVADALAHVHAAGVIHRDLKPGNILVCDDRAVLTDFGISRILDVPGVTTAGKVIGTFAYMSPEQLYNKPVLASDLWALGVTLYEAVEGHRPFHADTQPELFDAIRQHPLSPPRRAGALTALITALLDKDATRRPDARDTARTLRGAAM
nr:serine/threonine-protein kinase [Streptomyces sp. S3(2020)]